MPEKSLIKNWFAAQTDEEYRGKSHKQYVPSMQMAQPNAPSVLSPASQARIGLGLIGALTLVAGIILLIASFNTTAAHSALVSMVCGSLAILIGSFALIALLAVKARS